MIMPLKSVAFFAKVPKSENSALLDRQLLEKYQHPTRFVFLFQIWVVTNVLLVVDLAATKCVYSEAGFDGAGW